MKLHIEISLENAAFHDDPSEISRILGELIDKVENWDDEIPALLVEDRDLFDINGNRVGIVEVTL